MVTQSVGPIGFLAFKYLLVAGIGFVTIRAARARDAAWPIIFAFAPTAILIAQYGFTTIRAQVITMLFTGTLMWLIELDRRGNRLWIVPWIFAHLIWLNLHGGFVFGAMLLGAHWLEQLIRGKGIQPHLVVGGIVMMLLVLVNPWGIAYPEYLLRALTMKRSIIPEWQPIWKIAEPIDLATQGFSLLIVVYALLRCGWRGVPGIFGVAITAYFGIKSSRHASLFAIVWLACTPSWISTTPLGAVLVNLYDRRLVAVRWAAMVASVGLIISTIFMHPFTLFMKTLSDSDPTQIEIVYPTGATRYLAEQHFHGNVLTHFNVGAYVSWMLFPNAKVSLDGRYEVAYPQEVVDDVQAFYTSKPNWRDTLTKYPTDVVMVLGNRPIAQHLRTETDWVRVYRDDGHEIYARPGISLPIVDRAGQPVVPPANPFDVPVFP
jgi:hypothetical protein